MLNFLVRRTVGAILVIIAVTFIVFVIFIVVPGGDPAQRIAGKNATQQNIVNIRHDWGFDRPFYVQYYKMMQKMFSGALVSYTSQQNVLDQIKLGMPATFSLAIGAGIIWLFFGIVVGVVSAIKAGKLSDRVITVLALIGVSMPVFWLGIVTRYYLAEGGLTSIFPDGEYVALTTDPLQWFWHLVLPWTVSPCCSSASTGASCAGTSSTRRTRTTCAPRRRRGFRRTGSCASTFCACR